MRFIQVGSLCVVLIMAGGVWYWLQVQARPRYWGELSESQANHPEIRTAGKRITPLHRRKLRSERDPWLEHNSEQFGQTFNAYLRREANLPDEEHRKLYVLPLGEIPEPLQQYVEEVAELLELYYNISVEILPAIAIDGLPESARRQYPYDVQQQISADYLLSEVIPRHSPADAVAVLGLVTEDMWVPGRKWVTGMGLQNQRVGVWSTFRFGNPRANSLAEQQFRESFFRTAVHESGHMFGMPHCVAYHCLMNGAESREAADATPLWGCPECEQKIWWGFQANPRDRYLKLARFAKRTLLKKPAEFWDQSAAALKAE